jgi:hypothetical protein
MVHPSLFQGTKFIFYKFKIFVFILAPECHGDPATGACQLLVNQRGCGRAFLPGGRRRVGGRRRRCLADPGGFEKTGYYLHVSVFLSFNFVIVLAL